MKLERTINVLRDSAGLVEHLMAAIEQVLIAIVGRLATWAAPLPSAVLVGRSTAITFKLDGYWPWIMAGIVELIGLVTSSLWITAREWNLNKRKSDPPANEQLAMGLMAAYFVTTFALLLAIEVPIFAETGEWAGLTALLFPCLSAVALISLNERAAQSKRQGERDAVKTARPKSGQKAATKAAAKTGESAGFQPVITGKTKDRARAILAAQPGISGSELGRQLGKSPRTGRNLKQELLPLLASGNGREKEAVQETAIF